MSVAPERRISSAVTISMVTGTSDCRCGFPVALVVYFLRRGQRFDAAVCAVWVAESFMYMAEYLGDAQARRLPLVGGHIHDWHWLLTRAGLLEQCELIAAVLHGLACVGAIAATLWAAYEVRPGQAPVGEPLFDELA